jgi:hypothetical protein
LDDVSLLPKFAVGYCSVDVFQLSGVNEGSSFQGSHYFLQVGHHLRKRVHIAR